MTQSLNILLRIVHTSTTDIGICTYMWYLYETCMYAAYRQHCSLNEFIISVFD